jgi:3-oxoacyl-(acyl-carrier-protein) synthase
MRGIRTDEGMRALELSVRRGGPPVVGMVPIEWSKLLGRGAMTPPFLEKFAPKRTEEGMEGTTEFVQGLAGLSSEERVGSIEGMVMKIIREETGITVSHRDPLMDAGVDSLALVELRNALRQKLGTAVVLEQSLFVEYPTVAEMSVHISEQLLLAEQRAREAPAAEDKSVTPQDTAASVSITGMALRLPGVKNVSDLWHALDSGDCHVTQDPPQRWADACEVWGAPKSVLSGGFLEDVESFDAAHFGIGHGEADAMDPHIRIMLEVAAEALQDASGHGELPRKMGTFVAVSSAAFAMPTHSFNISRLIAKKLHLDGLCESFDVACTSSHSAIHRAREAILAGECTAALVVGALIQLVPPMNMSLLDDGILSTSGVSRPLDAFADGIVLGEACGALVLHREGMSSRVHASLIGSGLTQSSTDSVSLLAPDVMAQESAVTAALRSAALQPRDVSMVHIHGEGQQVADTSELHALRNTLLKERNGNELLLLNHKANFGHSVAASGVVAVITTVLAMQHREVPRHITVERLMKAVTEVDGLAVPLKKSHQFAGAETELIAAVHGHAISGINVHLLLSNKIVVGHVVEAPQSSAVIAPAHWQHRVAYSTRAAFAPQRSRVSQWSAAKVQAYLEENLPESFSAEAKQSWATVFASSSVDGNGLLQLNKEAGKYGDFRSS